MHDMGMEGLHWEDQLADTLGTMQACQAVNKQASNNADWKYMWTADGVR